MRVAVTGASGFIGAHVVAGLIDAGHDAYCIDQCAPAADVPYVLANIDQLDAITDALRGADVVMHLAAVANVNDVYQMPVESARTNFLGTIHVLEAARRLGMQRFILASTVWVYGGADASVDENSLIPSSGPGHLYSTTKLAAEMATHDYARLYNLPFTILRYGIPYGPRMRRELLIGKFLTDALAGQCLQVHGNGSQARPFIYIDDLVAAHVKALQPEAKNQVFNLPGPRLVSIREIAETVQALVGPVAINYTESRPGDLAGQAVSFEKASLLLNWRPRVDIRDGIARTLEWFREDLSTARAVVGEQV